MNTLKATCLMTYPRVPTFVVSAMQFPGPGTRPLRLKIRNDAGDVSAVLSWAALVTPARTPFAPTRPTRLVVAIAVAGTRIAEAIRPMAIHAPVGIARSFDMIEAPPLHGDASPSPGPEKHRFTLTERLPARLSA